MTDYRQISENDVRVDAELTSQLFDKLRLNPLAIAEGSESGTTPAPRYKIESLEESTCTSGTKSRLVAFRVTNRYSGNNTTDNLQGISWTCNRGGQYALHIYKPNDGSTTTGKVMIDGVEADSQTTGSAYWVVVTLEIGQKLRIDLDTNFRGTNFQSATMWVYSDNPFSEFECLAGFEARKQIATYVLRRGLNIERDIY